MPVILVSWIGNADLKGANDAELSGPLAKILSHQPFTHAYLLHNQPTDEITPLIDRFQGAFDTALEATRADLQSPIHFADIYRALDTQLAEITSRHPKSTLFIQLTSGTPAMTAVSILVGKTRSQSKCPIKFLQSSIEQGVQQVELPFDIAADFLPAVAEIQDERLASLMASQAPSTAEFDHIITQDSHMLRLKERAAVFALRDVPVLIHGETGTGKELFVAADYRADPSQECFNPFLGRLYQ